MVLVDHVMRDIGRRENGTFVRQETRSKAAKFDHQEARTAELALGKIFMAVTGDAGPEIDLGKNYLFEIVHGDK